MPLLNEIFSVTSEVVAALASLASQYSGNIENAEMKSNMDHIGKMGGLNHVKPERQNLFYHRRRETLFY